MRYINNYVVLIIYCAVCNAIAQEDIPKLHQYQNLRMYQTAEERYNLALNFVKNAEDTAATSEALKDLVKYSKAFDKDAESLAEVEALINNTDSGTELNGRAKLAKALFLMRLGQKDEAMHLFHQGVINRWGDNAFWDINDAFLETNRQAALAIDEYHRNTTDEYDLATRKHYGIGHDLSVFFIRMREATLANPNLSAMDDIFIYLEASSWRPHVLDTARAICLAFDNHVDESLAVLDEVDENVRRLDPRKNEHEEW